MPIVVVQGCKKNMGATTPASNPTSTSPVNVGFARYTIQKGLQFADGTETALEIVHIKNLHFIAIFDSSAIYQTDTAVNQHDINKLYGFADNNVFDHHAFSARFGWNWVKGQLWLYAYIYNNSVMSFKSNTAFITNSIDLFHLRNPFVHFFADSAEWALSG